MRNPDITYGLFRRQLNGHLFGMHERSALEKYLLTYLLTYLVTYLLNYLIV